MDARKIFVGIDLGSFKTSIASSEGVRETLPSAVAWPKDHVAKMVFGRDIVFGEDIFNQNLALNVIRPFERGALKFLERDDSHLSSDTAARHLDAARQLVRHVVSLVRPNQNSPIFGVLGAPSRASITCKQTMLSVVQDVFASAMIVPEPFAVAYGMNRLTNTLVVDIGAGTTDICPLYGALPRDEDQVTIPIGGDAIDDRFVKEIAEAFPEISMSPAMARKIKEKHGCVDDQVRQAAINWPVQGKPKTFDVADILRHACQVIVDPIIEGIFEVVARLDPEYQRSMLENVILAGGGSQLRGLDRMIEQGLEELGGGSVTRVYDSVFAGATGGLKLAMRMPLEEWERAPERAA